MAETEINQTAFVILRFYFLASTEEEVKIVTPQQWYSVTTKLSVTEGKKAQLQKGSTGWNVETEK